MNKIALAVSLSMSLVCAASAQQTRPPADDVPPVDDSEMVWHARRAMREAREAATRAKEAADKAAKEREAAGKDKADRQAANKAAEAAGPCAKNKELSANGFVFTLDSKKDGQDDGLKISFIYESCRVEKKRATDVSEESSRAVRTYYGDQLGYSLTIETEQGASKSKLTIVQTVEQSGDKTLQLDVPKPVGDLGARDNATLLKDAAVDLGTVTVGDTRVDAKRAPRKGRATIKAASFSKGYDVEGYNGCQ